MLIAAQIFKADRLQWRSFFTINCIYLFWTFRTYNKSGALLRCKDISVVQVKYMIHALAMQCIEQWTWIISQYNYHNQTLINLIKVYSPYPIYKNYTDESQNQSSEKNFLHESMLEIYKISIDVYFPFIQLRNIQPTYFLNFLKEILWWHFLLPYRENIKRPLLLRWDSQKRLRPTFVLACQDSAMVK